MVKDAGDKLSASDRAPIESAIEELKKAIEKNDVDDMKRKLEALNTAQHKAAETMYKTASASGAPGGQPGGGAGASGGAESRDSGDVIDAEVVEEEKK
jgi:molecular chaperone DnaK